MKTAVILLLCALALAVAQENFDMTEPASAERSLLNANDMHCTIEKMNVLTCYTIANLENVQFDEDLECSTFGDITKCARILSDVLMAP